MESERGHAMEQKPVQGQEALAPPSADIAQRYLDEADAVEERRNSQVSTRLQAWTTLIGAAVVFLFVTSNIGLLRLGESSTVPLLVVLMAASAQIISGVAERGGAQRRFTRGRWLYYGAIALCVLGVLVSAVLYITVGDDASFLLLAGPAWSACLILVGIGLVQLWSSRHAPRARPDGPTAFRVPARVTTFVLGLVLAAAVVAVGLGDPLLSSVVTILAGAGLITVSIAARSDWGLAYLGEVWRWPQIVVVSIGALVLCALAIAPSFGAVIDSTVALVAAGALAIAGFFVSRPLRARANDRG